MASIRSGLAIASCSAFLFGCASPSSGESRAKLFANMGPHGRAITTSSEEAQHYFDQGLTWYFAFNHDEAVRSFERAAELDPDCAMAWWGVALGEGPNYNDPVMTEGRSAAAWQGLQNARARIDNTTPVERDLIEALSHRYVKPWPEDRSGLEKAYAKAMAEVYGKYPDDADVGTLYAESMMMLRPWKLYSLDFEPAEGTERIVAVLERVMRIDPGHPGAAHLYIHAVEPSSDPYRGLRAARTLDDMVYGSGHLLHMPSHIYVKTGHWDDAIVQNEKAMASDVGYRRLSPEQGIQWMYMVHNSHMLAYAAMMSGREREAMAAARRMWSDIPEDALKKVGPLFDRWMSSVYDVQKRFGRWDDILAEPAPPSYLPVTTAIWRTHRAIAYAAKKDFENAEREYAEFKKVRDSLPEEHMSAGEASAQVLEVSDHFIAGEIALQKGEWEQAVEHLEQGAVVEDRLSYGEPPQWLQPIRHTLGAVHLKSGQWKEAERAYREDLAKWPENGWSLYGLHRALQEQGRTEEAAEVRARFDRVWAKADRPIESSCLCIPRT